MGFQTTFHLAADQDLIVEAAPINKWVCVTLLEGVDYGPDSPDTTRKAVVELNLSKSRARAIASAIMGAAAEV